MKKGNIKSLQDRLSDVFLLDLLDTNMTNPNWKRNSNRRQARAPLPPHPPPFLSERQRFTANGGPYKHPRNQRVAPYQIPMHPIPPNESRPPRHVAQRPRDRNTPPTLQRNHNRTTVISPPRKQSLNYHSDIPPSTSNRSPSDSFSRENPPKKPSSPPPSGKPTAPREAWRIQ